MNKKDYLTLAIYFADEKGLTPIQLQKILFLISQELTLRDFYKFIPYHYGPFDQEIYDDAKNLREQGKIIKSTVGRSYPTYIISPSGTETVAHTLPNIAQNEADFIKKIVTFVQGLSFRELVEAIYKNFPDFAVNSVLKEQ